VIDEGRGDKRGPSADWQSPCFIFGVSGHRDLVPSNVEELRAQIGIVFDRFRLAYPDLGYELLSPLAEGADRAAAEVALNCGIRLIVPLPMEQREYERDFATSESVAEFRQLLARADSHLEVSDKDRKGATGRKNTQRWAIISHAGATF
jgi:hypothetical protein